MALIIFFFGVEMLQCWSLNALWAAVITTYISTCPSCKTTLTDTKDQMTDIGIDRSRRSAERATNTMGLGVRPEVDLSRQSDKFGNLELIPSKPFPAIARRRGQAIILL